MIIASKEVRDDFESFEMIKSSWRSVINSRSKGYSEHEIMGEIVNKILNKKISKSQASNCTVIALALKNLTSKNQNKVKNSDKNSGKKQKNSKVLLKNHSQKGTLQPGSTLKNFCVITKKSLILIKKTEEFSTKKFLRFTPQKEEEETLQLMSILVPS